jgi:hypothetical protein
MQNIHKTNLTLNTYTVIFYELFIKFNKLDIKNVHTVRFRMII